MNGSSATMSDSPTADIPADLIAVERYRLDDEGEHATILAEARRQLAAEGCAMLPGFVRPAAAAAMADEIQALVPRAHRRDVMLNAYGPPPDADLPPDHPRARTHPYCMHVVASDLFASDGPVMRLYLWDGLTRLIASALGEAELHRCADPLLRCNATVMGAGDQHGWHFDSNDFVVTVLLQAASRGGEFEFAPGIRDDTDPAQAEVAAAMDGTSPRLRRLRASPGTLILFRGKHALHRVTPIDGQTRRIIAIFSYDRRPDMQFSDRTRLRAVGRTSSIA
jgi:hypothetical protein